MSSLLSVFLAQQNLLRQIVSKYRSNPNDIEEIVQETFTRGFAMEKEVKINQPDRYLKKIAKNLAISHAEKKEMPTNTQLKR